MRTPDKARALIYQDNKILMLWRFHNGFEYHVLPGGTQEDGENIEETLFREVMEEVNLNIDKFKLIHVFNNKFEENELEYDRDEYFYFIPKFSGEVKLGGPELLEQSQNNVYRPEWISLDEIDKIDYRPKVLFKKLKEVVKDYGQK